jgi:hypothetical protein
VPDGQPFGLGPAGVAVAAQHASIYARPLRRSAYRPSRPATTAPDGAPRTRRSGAFGFTTMPTVALCRPPGDTAVVPSRSTGQHALVIPSAAIWRCQLQ